MKKILAVAALICATTVSYGASIIWGGDIGLPPNGDDSVQAGSVAYLIRGTTAANAAITTIMIDGADWTKWTTDTGASIVGAYTLNELEATSNYRFDATYNITGASDAGFYSVVVVDGSAGADGLKGSYNYAGQNTLVDPTSGANTDLTIGDNWGGSGEFIGKGGFSSVAFTAVPEPTSGLLMLVGLAGLALRRRRA